MSRNFYVNAELGNDKNNGLTPDAAWCSLDRVNRHDFMPGDRVLFARGQKWEGMLAPKGDGAFGAPWVIGAYGDGDRPVIAGRGAAAGVYLNGNSFCRVESLKVTNHAEERAVRSGITIMAKPEGITENIEITDCEVCDVTGENRRSMGPYKAMYWNGGIYVSFPGRTSDRDHLHDVIISKNYIHDVLTSGIRVHQMEDGLIDIHHTHVVLRGNRIERTGSDGIIVANCISPLIAGNICYDAGALGTYDETIVIAGVWCCATRDALFTGNEVARTRLFQNDGTAFDTDWGTQGTTVFQYNYTHDNEGGFFLDCSGIGHPDPECGRTVLRGNISLNDHRCITQDCYDFPCDFDANYFEGPGNMPMVCAYRTSGEMHNYTHNVFNYKGAPEKGWQGSHFLGNFYGFVPGNDDASAVTGLPFTLPEHGEEAPEGMDWCRSVFSALCKLYRK